MSWFGRLRGRGGTPEGPVAPPQFVTKALRGSADCRVYIQDWPELHQRLTTGLMNEGKSNGEIIDLMNDRLLGVCPRCSTWTGGQALFMVAGVERLFAGPTIFTGNSGGMERFSEGQCRNYSCSSSEILIFWKPDESQDAMARLGKMGIKIKPRC